MCGVLIGFIIGYIILKLWGNPVTWILNKCSKKKCDHEWVFRCESYHERWYQCLKCDEQRETKDV